jgi:transcription termination factor Rho
MVKKTTTPKKSETLNEDVPVIAPQVESIDDLVGRPEELSLENGVESRSDVDPSIFVGSSTEAPVAPAQESAPEIVAPTPEEGEKAPRGVQDIPVEPIRPRRAPLMGNTRRPIPNGGNYRSNNYSANGGNRRPPERDRFNGTVDDRIIPDADAHTEIITGILDTSQEGHGVLRANFSPSERDAYISSSQIRRFRLRPGDVITGPARAPKENERYWGLLKVDTVNGKTADQMGDRIKFSSLTPVYPNEQIKLETGEEPLSTRVVDMVAPIGKGQRSLIVSPPKAGKTTLLMDIATGVARNHPDVHLMAVLVGERPEEVTDFRRHIDRITKGKGEAAASNFDESAEDQCRVAELALERAKRLVEEGKDVVILLDSITRLARAYNLSIPTSGRTLSGGFDPAALFPPKKFFGAARNFEVGGSLTIIGTALVDTGSRMDDLVFEEFKGTGNQEIRLDRRLAERRIYPSIDVQQSGTRHDELLIEPMTYQSILTLQRMLDMVDKEERTQTLIGRMKRYGTNKEFLASLKEG